MRLRGTFFCIYGFFLLSLPIRIRALQIKLLCENKILKNNTISYKYEI